MHKIFKTLGIIAILVLLTGVAQAGDWPMFHHDARHTGYTDEKVPDDLELLWSYETGGQVESSPAVANGKVFVGSHDGQSIFWREIYTYTNGTINTRKKGY